MSRLLSEEEYRKTNAFKIKRWYRGDKDPYIGKVEMKPQEPFVEDVSSMRQRIHDEALLKRNIYDIEHNRKLRAFSKIYSVISVVFVFTLIAILLYVVSYLPPVGNPANPDNNEVARKYIEDGMKDTGAVNIVTGMILDYRAFDTLGESNVLFIATCTVLILLRVDNCSKKRRRRRTTASMSRKMMSFCRRWLFSRSGDHHLRDLCHPEWASVAGRRLFRRCDHRLGADPVRQCLRL